MSKYFGLFRKRLFPLRNFQKPPNLVTLLSHSRKFDLKADKEWKIFIEPAAVHLIDNHFCSREWECPVSKKWQNTASVIFNKNILFPKVAFTLVRFTLAQLIRNFFYLKREQCECCFGRKCKEMKFFLQTLECNFETNRAHP